MPSELPEARLLELALVRPAMLGPGRLICIDGPAGSGKTTLAEAVAALAADVTVVHTDDLVAGWGGLPRLAQAVHAMLAPLAEGRPGTWTRWDWHASAWAEPHRLAPGGVLVVEGVGSWSPGIAPWVAALAWVDAPYDVRKSRGLARDGDDVAPHWDQWAADEATLFARHRTREHADLVLAT